MTKVYIPNKGAHDYSKAVRYGELVYCTEGVLGKYNISHMIRQCKESMEDSQEGDFILLTSLTSLCSVVCSIFVLKHRRLNLLIFKDGDYVERRVIFE